MFEKMQTEIRRREINIQGVLNPNLSNFGEDSEARQYAGNATASGWLCPFNKKN
jgi:FPC/CPF motif-containing protein YcgG